jgi:hypothetical protein
MANDQLHHKRATSLEKLRRRQGKREPQKTYLIVCEGITEVNYFQALYWFHAKNVKNAKVIVTQSDDGTDPISIVNYAIKQLKIRYYDAVICVFDKEFDNECHIKFKQANQNLERLAKQYKKQKIIGAWSVPCFELWFLLHFEPSSSPFDSCEAVEKKLKTKEKFEKYDKAGALLHNSQAVDNKNEFLWHFYNNFRLSQGQLKTYATTPKAGNHHKFLSDKTESALSNAAALYEESQHNQSDNPSTTVHLTVEFLLKEFNPQ